MLKFCEGCLGEHDVRYASRRARGVLTPVRGQSLYTAEERPAQVSEDGLGEGPQPHAGACDLSVCARNRDRVGGTLGAYGSELHSLTLG